MKAPGPLAPTNLFQRLADPAEPPAQRCELCRFVLAPPVPDELRGKVDQMYLCRRFPPTLAMLAIPAPLPPGVLLKKNEAPPVTFTNQSVIPQVTPDAWCGEFLEQKKL